MEQFRAFLEKLKKYHFWVLCGLILLLSFVSWYLATSDEQQRFATRKGQIEGKLRLVKDIANNAEHPSATYIEQIRKIESGSLTSQVANASARLYNEQRMNNSLPRLFLKDDEQAGFEAAFEKIWQPMEDIAKLPATQLDGFYRDHYQNHVAQHFPDLFRLIERRTTIENSDDSGGGRASGMGLPGGDAGTLSKSTSGIVDWVDADQKIKTFRDRFSGTTPSTLDIMLAQEDLWVYETLLKVIRYTNNVGPDRTQYPKPANEKEARSSSNLLPAWLEKHYQKPANHKVARIKQILAMDIGRDAVKSWGDCERAVFNLAGEGGGAGQPSARMPIGHGGPAGGGASGESALAGRYVDDNGQPLPDPSQQPYGEFRMVPINLKVVIEQKDIPRLLAECANSAMRIDVRRVRFLVQTPPPVDLVAEGAGGGAPGASVEATPSPGPSMHGFGVGHGGSDAGGSGDFVYQEESADAFYQPVPVEVQGIIYIYNPPKIQNAVETSGDNSGQPAAASPAAVGPSAAPAAGIPSAPQAAPTPGKGLVSPAGVPTNPPITPARGGHP